MPRLAVMKEAGLGPPVFRDHVRAIVSKSNPAFDKWLDSLLAKRGLPPRQNSAPEEDAATGIADTPAAAAPTVPSGVDGD